MALQRVDRKTAKAGYISGKVITMFRAGETFENAPEVWEFSNARNIKETSKARKFNDLVKTFSEYAGEPSFWLDSDN